MSKLQRPWPIGGNSSIRDPAKHRDLVGGHDVLFQKSGRRSKIAVQAYQDVG
jgi:hypothetical protein